MDVGFVGTGNMGRPMAANVQKAGHRLTVYDINPAATKPLEEQGATRAADLPAVARAARVTLLSLPNEKIVEEVVLGAPGRPGLVDGASDGHIVFDLSTVSPESTCQLARRAAERGVRLIDASVSGGVGGAEAGTLAVMIGAPPEAVDPYRSIFDAIGSNIFCLGELGRGNILKLINNLVALTNGAVLCQAMALADRVGVDRQTAGDVIGKASGNSFMLERKLPALVEHDYEAGFYVELSAKDLRLAVELAKQAGARLDIAAQSLKLYEEAEQQGLGKLDSCGVLKILEP